MTPYATTAPGCTRTPPVEIPTQRLTAQNGPPMVTVPNTTDSTPRTQESALLLGLAAYRDAVDRFPDLTAAQRRAVLVATADLLGDLRAARVIR